MYITSWHENGNPKEGRVFYLNRLYIIEYEEENDKNNKRKKLKTTTFKQNENINKDNCLEYEPKNEDVEEIEWDYVYDIYTIRLITSRITSVDQKHLGSRRYCYLTGMIRGQTIQNLFKENECVTKYIYKRQLSNEIDEIEISSNNFQYNNEFKKYKKYDINGNLINIRLIRMGVGVRVQVSYQYNERKEMQTKTFSFFKEKSCFDKRELILKEVITDKDNRILELKYHDNNDNRLYGIISIKKEIDENGKNKKLIITYLDKQYIFNFDEEGKFITNESTNGNVKISLIITGDNIRVINKFVIFFCGYCLSFNEAKDLVWFGYLLRDLNYLDVVI